MTEKEVEEVLGLPAGDYSTGPVGPVFASLKLHDFKKWTSDTGIILIFLSPDGRVHNKSFQSVHRVGDNPLDMLHRWLGVQVPKKNLRFPVPTC